MPNMTISLSEEDYALVKKHNTTRWSAVAAQAIRKQAQLLERMDKLAENSVLTEEDIQELDVKLKERIAKHYNS